MTFHSINPATDEHLQDWQKTPDAEIDRRLETARTAFSDWSTETFDTRAAVLLKLAEVMRRDARELAQLATREMGKPITQAFGEIEKCAVLCEHYAKAGKSYLASRDLDLSPGHARIVPQPLGPVFSIAPWNFPYWQVLRFAVPSLALGNTVVLKHAPNVLGCAAALEALFNSIDAPAGIFQSVVADNDQAATIIQDDRIVGVALTGSERAGAAVAQIAGRALKKCVLELGGSDPFIVLQDSDIEQAAKAAAASRFVNAGQVCIAAKRIIVDAEIASAFSEAFIAAVEELPVGPPEDEGTFIGPMARKDLRDELAAQVESSIAMGARPILPGGKKTGPGAYFAPAVLANVPEHAAVRCAETFGPAAALIVADDAPAAIKIANDSLYGLSASIWSRDAALAEAVAMKLEAGNVFINQASASDPRLPFGGVKRSGFGRELGKDGILEFANIKTLSFAGDDDLTHEKASAAPKEALDEVR